MRSSSSSSARGRRGDARASVERDGDERRARARPRRERTSGGEGGKSGRERRGDDDDEHERGRGRREEDVSVDAFERVVVVVARDDVVEEGRGADEVFATIGRGACASVRGGHVRGGGGDVRRPRRRSMGRRGRRVEGVG